MYISKPWAKLGKNLLLFYFLIRFGRDLVLQISDKNAYAGILVLQVLIRTNRSLLWRHSMSLVLRQVLVWKCIELYKSPSFN